MKNITLREKKYAHTKVDLLKSMLNKTRERRFSDLSVKELCEDVVISEATFFNYFPKKTDLIFYFIQMWTIQTEYLAEKEFGNYSGLKKIEFIFSAPISGKTIGNERIMSEIISFWALEGIGSEYKLHDTELDKITDAELVTAFPGYEKIENVPKISFNNLFLKNLQLAVNLGELPRETDLDFILMHIMIAFFGLPLLLGKKIFQVGIPVSTSILNEIWELARHKYGSKN